MITGGKVGAIIGRKRAFAIGCVIYGCGSFTTALAPEPPRAPVRLVVPRGGRRGADPARDRGARRRQLPARAPARRVRPGRRRGSGRDRGRPAHRRLLHDVLLLALGVRRRGGHRARRSSCSRGGSPTRRSRSARSSTSSAPCSRRSGSGSSSSASSARASGAGSSPSPTARPGLGLSPVVWLMLGGLLVIWLFFQWEARRVEQRPGTARPPRMLRNRQLTGGLAMFFFQFLVQAGFFFVVPLFLSVALGLSALETGARLLPLSITCSSPRSGSRASSRRRLAAAGGALGPARCSSPGPSSCWPRSTSTPGRRSSSSPCS